jgi:hypothetical protein
MDQTAGKKREQITGSKRSAVIWAESICFANCEFISCFILSFNLVRGV